MSSVLSAKELGNQGEAHAMRLLHAHGYAAEYLPTNTPTYDLAVSRGETSFCVSVKVSREKQHVRLGSRRSVLGLTAGNFVFAYLPPLGCSIAELESSPQTLLILPAELVRNEALSIHDAYWHRLGQDPNIFSVMVKGYGKHHRAIWPQWLEYRDAWHLLP